MTPAEAEGKGPITEEKSAGSALTAAL